MHKLKLKILPNQYSIHRLKDKNVIASLLKRNNIFFSFTSTNEETSLICDSKIKILNSDKDDNWSCIQLIGQLKIEETGIWSRITTVCADSGCAVLTVTTFKYAATEAIIKRDKELTPNGIPNTTSAIIPDKNI